MKALKATEFPALRRVFSGYLHEDALVEHGTAADALRAFCEDASASENQQLQIEAREFLARIDGAGLKDVRALMAALGSRWVPPSRKALAALLAELTKI